VWWGYGLFHDRPGDCVKKPLVECTGAEILEEVLRPSSRFSAPDSAAVLAASTILRDAPYHQPFMTKRAIGRWWCRTGRQRLAFLGQYAEQLTMSCSRSNIRSAAR
jgi:oleate hydratase